MGNLLTQHTRQPNRWATYDSNYVDTCEVMQHTDTCSLDNTENRWLVNGWSHYIGGCHRIAPGRVEFSISTFTGELVGEFGLLLLL